MKLALHIGAHKTATSYIQRKLTANAGRLLKRSVSAPPLAVTRADFTSIITKLSRIERSDAAEKQAAIEASGVKAAAFLSAHAPKEAGRLVISDENLIGSSRHVMERKQLYYMFAERMTCLSEVLGDRQPEFYFCIRNFADFFASAYCETLRAGPLRSFNGPKRKLYARRHSWCEMIETLRETFPDAPITVWRYEDFRALENRCLNEICGIEPDDEIRYKTPEAVARVSFSHRMVDELLKMTKREGVEKARAAIPDLDKQFPKGDSYAAYDPWKSHQRAALDKMYADDVAAIETRFPGILMKPGDDVRNTDETAAAI